MIILRFAANAKWPHFTDWSILQSMSLINNKLGIIDLNGFSM